MSTTGDTTSATVRFTYTGQRQVEIPRNISHLTVHSSATEIGVFWADEMKEGMEFEGYAFNQLLSSLRQILQVPEDESIGGSFFGLSRDFLVQVELQEGLQAIGAYAFANCKFLKKISVPSTVERIENAAFRDCTTLFEVHLQAGLKTIGKHSFSGCESLFKVSLPSTVETIGDFAFARCKSLSNVSSQNGLKAIGACSFSRCESLLSISLPSTVETLGQSSFWECESLVDVELREGLQEIEETAFHGCTSLYTLRIPTSTTRIGEYAFSMCNNLLGVEFAENARAVLEAGCFRLCTNLINVSLFSTMGEIADNSFWECTSLLQEGVVDDHEVIEPILRGRFTGLPIHQLCYHSSTSSAVDLGNRIQDTSTDDKKSKDMYGMTPFHVLATSATLRADLLEVLLDEYPVDTLGEVNVNGHTMLEYLLMNKSTTATPLIKLILQRVLVMRMESFGLGRWKHDISLQVESTDWSGNFESSRACLNGVLERLASCAKVEMTSLLELALWKRKRRSFFVVDNEKRRKVDRENCHALSGADEVMANVMDYLWNGSGSEESIDVSMIPYDVSCLKQAGIEEASTGGEEALIDS
ncbi:MAG: hypothetical protein SGBAC_001425 [Bacillariaceae sp.]